jgi:hypothetical protein
MKLRAAQRHPLAPERPGEFGIAPVRWAIHQGLRITVCPSTAHRPQDGERLEAGHTGHPSLHGPFTVTPRVRAE